MTTPDPAVVRGTLYLLKPVVAATVYLAKEPPKLEFLMAQVREQDHKHRDYKRMTGPASGVTSTTVHSRLCGGLIYCIWRPRNVLLGISISTQ